MDGFPDLEAFAALRGLMGSTETPELEELERQHATLVAGFKDFSREKTMSIIGSLLTYPALHANTIRLETLQQLAQRNCKGTNKPRRDTIVQWLEAIGTGWAAAMEDPVEDVFISNVVTNIGNSRVFEGIWEANDFWLQQCLNALRAFQREQWAEDMFTKINGALVISEELARRCAVPRFVMGGGLTRTDLDIPNEGELEIRSAHVHFSAWKLSAMGISLDFVQDFLHDEGPALGMESNSTLQRRPLQRFGQDLVVALPAAISPAIRLYVVEQLIRLGKVEAYETALYTRQINHLFVDGLQSLRTERFSIAELPPLPPNNPARIQEIAKFDHGKFAHVIFFEDRVRDFSKDGRAGVLDLLNQPGDEIVKHTQRCAEIVAERRDYRGGLTIAVIGGLGRSFVFGVGELPPHWYGTAFGLPDIVALSRVHRTRLLDIWKFKEQELSLRSRDVQLMNVNGELNLLGFWGSHGERLVPKNVPVNGRTIIQVGTDFIAGVRQEMRTKYDFHAVPRRNPDIWAPVRRYNIESHFHEVEGELIYADEEDAHQGRFRGVVETERRYWWLSTVERYKDRLHHDIQFQIWEALLNWLPKLVAVAEEIFDNLPEGPIEFLLRFSELEVWRSESLHDLPEAPQQIPVRISRKFTIIELTLHVGFLRLFAQPRNIAERELIDACFKGIAALLNRAGAFDRTAAVQRVVSNDDARFFHIAYAQNFRQHTASTNRLRPQFIGEGDVNFASVGLVQRLLPGSSSCEQLTGEEQCNRFLHAVVDDCWDRARPILEKLERHSVVTVGLENVEAIEQDRYQWDLKAKAVLATHVDRDDVTAAAGNRENDRSAAALVSRVIVEMAVCTSPSEGNAMSRADLDVLLGLVRLLLYAATSSDAIRYRLTPASLELFANGEFAAIDDYYKTIIQPYTAEQFVGRFNAAAEEYAEHFIDPSKKSSPAKPFEGAFVEAFSEEYGLTPDELVHAFRAVEAEGMSYERLVVSQTNEEFRVALSKEGLPAEKADRLLRNFALWPRRSWDDTPTGFLAKDWHPWRYRRRLSLLARPFVRLGDALTDKIVFAPGLVRDCIEMLFIRLLSGWLPAEAFQSSAMRSWIGEITRRRGDEFEEQVGAELREVSLETLVSRPMSLFGANESYGDLDVLAWTEGARNVYAIECKRLRSARTVAEIGEQLHEFEGGEMDRLARHLRRCRWLTEHSVEVRRVTRMQPPDINVVPLLVTSTIVPMQFVKDLPIPAEQIVPFTRLRQWITSRTA